MSFELLISPDTRPEPSGPACLLVHADDGQAVARAADAAAPPELNGNVRLDADGVTVVATAAGRVVVDGNRLSVVPAFVVRGNVDPGTGNVDAQTEVFAGGNVSDCMKVASASGVYVRGSVEAADISCAGDLHVGRGIAGKHKGVCRVGGTATVRFLDGGHLRAKGRITAASEIGRSRVITSGGVRVDGPVFASHVTANGGVWCKTLGAPADVKTVVEAGLDQDLIDLCAATRPKIDHLLRQAGQIRQSVEPLMRNAKHLSAAQKEKATEFLFQADEYETQAAALLRELRRAHAAATAAEKAEVYVDELLHVGVTLRFRGIEATTKHAFRGPIVVSAKRIDHTTVVCVQEAGKKDFVTLDSHAIPDKEYEWLEQTLRPVKPAA